MDSNFPPSDGPPPHAQPPSDAPPPQTGPPPHATPPMTPIPGMAMHYPEESQALVALLMSVIGLVVCSGLLCPVGWYLGSKEIEAIDAGRRDPSKRDLAMAGKIVGIIGTVLLAIGVAILIAMLVFFLAVGAASA